MAYPPTIDVRDALRQIVMVCHIGGARRLALRIRLALLTLRLAAWLLGCGIEFEPVPVKVRSPTTTETP